MRLKKWLDRGELQKIEISPKAISDLERLVDRDLQDAQIEALSIDRRFATAYGAALTLANLLIRREGYRVMAKRGHHKVAFEIAGNLLGKEGEKFILFFDVCRRKRNKVDYDFADVVSETEMNELIKVVLEFKSLVIGI